MTAILETNKSLKHTWKRGLSLSKKLQQMQLFGVLDLGRYEFAHAYPVVVG